MMKKLFISLVMVISLSFFITTAHYRENIANATISHQQLSFLEDFDYFTNTDQQLAQLKTNEKVNAWLHLATLHGNSSAKTAYQLAEYYYANNQLDDAQLWYQSAVRQHHVNASIKLANIYFYQQRYNEAEALLKPVLNNPKALTVAYKLALQLGDVSFIESYKNSLAASENTAFYQELVSFSVFGNKQNQQNLKLNANYNDSCLIDIELFATNLDGLRHGSKLISSFNSHPFAKLICLSSPQYISAQVLQCHHDEGEKIACNTDAWAKRSNIDSRYIGVIVQNGSANVDNGIMYLDQGDDLKVFVHELSHFLGFVDEYPLPMKHQKCQQAQKIPFAHNIVVMAPEQYGSREQIRKRILAQVPWRNLIKDTTPVLTKQKQGWKIATPYAYMNEVGLFAASTCNEQASTQAFKPIYARTQMEYFELEFPDLYLTIMKLAPKSYLMPSYHFNISRDLAKQGEIEKAKNMLKNIMFD